VKPKYISIKINGRRQKESTKTPALKTTHNQTHDMLPHHW